MTKYRVTTVWFHPNQFGHIVERNFAGKRDIAGIFTGDSNKPHEVAMAKDIAENLCADLNENMLMVSILGNRLFKRPALVTELLQREAVA